MKPGLLFVVLALAPAWGQIRLPTTGAVAPSVKAPAPGAGLPALEKSFDDALQVIGAPDRVQLRGFTRGIKIDDYGVIFTAEVDLVMTPTINIFQGTITPAQTKDVHERKLTNLELLRKAIREMMTTSANTLTALPMDSHMVVAVRLAYQSWEDHGGLPSSILMKGLRRDVLAGNIQTEEQ
jgi:hypothetical protein